MDPATASALPLPPLKSEIDPEPGAESPGQAWPLLRAMVLRANPDLQALREALRGAQAGITTARALPNPELNVDAGTHQRRIPEGIPGPSQVYGLNWRIENPRMRQARIDVARQGRDVAEAQFAVATNDVLAEARSRLYEYALRQDEIRAAEDSLALLEQIRDRVAVRVRSGEGPRYETIKAEAEVLAARQQVDDARTRAERSRIELQILTGNTLPPEFAAHVALTEGLNAQPVPAVIDLHNPELRRLEHELRRAQARIDQERHSVIPGIQLRLQQSREPDIRSTQIGLGVSIPLFDRRQGPVAEAQAEAERLRTLLNGRRIAMERQAAAAQQALALAQRKIAALQTGVLREAQNALRVAETAYRFGERGLLEVIDAQRVLRAAQYELLRARFEYHAAFTELDRLRGAYALAPTPYESATSDSGLGPSSRPLPTMEPRR